MRVFRGIRYERGDILSHGQLPFMRHLYAYVNDGKEGYVEFDGHFYVQDEKFPVRFIINETLYEEQSSTPVQKSGETGHLWFPVKCHQNTIEVYKREHIEDTSVYGYDEEFGCNVCFTPSERMRLYFRVLNVVDTKQIGKKYKRIVTPFWEVNFPYQRLEDGYKEKKEEQ